MGFLEQLGADLESARSLYANRRFEEGLQITGRYVGPTSRNRDFLSIHATLLHGSYRFADADPYLDRLLQVDPSNLSAIVARASGLRYIGRSDEALSLLETAWATHHDHGPLLGAYLNLLLTQSGLTAAMDVLNREARRPIARQCLSAAVEEFRQKVFSLHDPEDLASLDPDNLLGLKDQAKLGSYTLAQVYAEFEPLGANCEFGFIQRSRGAEPLALLRWTSIAPSNLIRLLASDLVSYDDANNYSLEGIAEKEFLLRDSVYETVSHTGVNNVDVTAEELLERLTRRQKFLKRKFLADLAEGKKIFIYKAADQISENEMADIEANLVRLGARHTMFTMLTDDPSRVDTVIFPSSTRAIAYLPSKPFSESLANWDKVIVRVYDHFNKGK